MLVSLTIIFLAWRRWVSGFLRLVLWEAPSMAVVIRHGQIGVSCEGRQLAVCGDPEAKNVGVWSRSGNPRAGGPGHGSEAAEVSV